MTPTYEDKALVQTKQAREELCREITLLWQRAETAATGIVAQEINVVNLLRQIGVRLHAASGRDQLHFHFEGRQFFGDWLKPHLPPTFTIKAAQLCVHIANNVNTDLRTREELKAVKRELQLGLFALGAIDDNRRDEPQKAIARNLFSACVAKLSMAFVSLEDVTEDLPMEDWSRQHLEDFLQAAEPLKERIDRAEKLLLEK